MPVHIVAQPIPAEELKPGDLFSLAGPEHWNYAIYLDPPVPNHVYIRNALSIPDSMKRIPLFLITIVKTDA